MNDLRHATLQQTMNAQYGYPPYSPPVMPSPMYPPQRPPMGGGTGETMSQYPNKNQFPTTGSVNNIYVDASTNVPYIWNGTEYVPLGGNCGCGGASQYENKDKFPEKGNEGTLYVDSETKIPYIWDGEKYEPLTTPTPEGAFEKFEGKDHFPTEGKDGVIYVDSSNMVPYIWDGEKYVPLHTPSHSKDTCGVEQYPSSSDFPFVGDRDVLYVDREAQKVYYWDGTNYVSIVSQTIINNGGGNSGCGNCNHEDDCCIWGDVINGGSLEDIAEDCPIDHNCGCCGTGGDTPVIPVPMPELNKINIINALGYTPAKEADLNKAVEDCANADAALTDKIEEVRFVANSAKTTANAAKNVADKNAEDIAQQNSEIADIKKAVDAVNKTAEAAKEKAKVAMESVDQLPAIEQKAQQAKETANAAKDIANEAKDTIEEVKKVADDVAARLSQLEKAVADNKKATDNLVKDVDDVKNKVHDFESSLTDVNAEIGAVQSAIEDIKEALDIEISASTWELIQVVELRHDEHDIAFEDIDCRKIYASCTICGSDDNDSHQRFEVRINKNDSKHRIVGLERAVPASSRDTRYTNLYAHALNTGKVGGYVQKDSDYPDSNFILQSLSTRSPKNEEIDFGTKINSVFFNAGDIGKFGVGTKIVLYGIK